MNSRVRGLVWCGLLLTVWSCGSSDQRQTASTPAETSIRAPSLAADRTFWVIAHRGNSSAAPENTLAAIHSAIGLGVDLIEIDVRLTKDGVPVVFHDEKLDRTTDGTGLLRETTLADLKTLDAGSWKGEQFKGERIPTLAEALEAVRGKGRLLLDVPIDRIADRIAAVFHSIGLSPSDAIIGTWSPEQRKEFKKHMPDASTFLSEGAPASWDGAFFARQREAGVVAFEIANWTPEFIAAAHAHGMPVYVYTVNDEPTMRALIEAGADGIETDVPALAIRVARELGVRR